MQLVDKPGHRRLSLWLPGVAFGSRDQLLLCSPCRRTCAIRGQTAAWGRNPLAPALVTPEGSQQNSIVRLRVSTRAVPPPAEAGSTSTPFPQGGGLSRQGRQQRLQMDFRKKGSNKQFCIGSVAAGDFPDSPEDGWATALAYREHVLRVVERLREDPGAEVQVAEVDGKGRRLRAWAPGDESVRPSVLAAIRKELGHEPRGKSGRPKVNTDLPEGSGLGRSEGELFMYQRMAGKPVRIGRTTLGDFPDSPGDGWATALAYRVHVLRVVERLREDPGAEVQVAEVDRRGRRLRAWAPGDESVRLKVLTAVQEALGCETGEHDLPPAPGFSRHPDLMLRKTVGSVRLYLGSAASGDFPDSPEDGWATALAYRKHALGVLEKLRKGPGAEVQVAEVDIKGRRLRAWAPGDESLRPSVLEAMREALLEALAVAGRRTVNTDLPKESGFVRSAGKVQLRLGMRGKQVLVGAVTAGDFPDSPEDGWATALAYREHVLQVVERLREDPGAEVQVAEVDGKGRRLQAWVPGDESVRPSVLAAIRGALTGKE